MPPSTKINTDIEPVDPQTTPTNPETVKEPDPNAAATPAAVEFASRYLSKPKKETPSDKPPGEDKKPVARKKPRQTPTPHEESKPVIDEEKLGRAIGETISKSLPTSKQEKVEDKGPSVPASEARRIRVLEQMEKNWPDQYKGFADKFKANMQKLREYAANWEKENPGKKFDEDDEDHAEFVAALEAEIAYDSDDYAEALADIKISEKVGAKTEEDPKIAEMNRRLDDYERKEKIRESQPQMVQASVEAGNEFWREMGEEFKGVVDAEGNINLEALNALKSKGEDVYDRIVNTAKATEGYARLVFLLDSGLIDYDAKNPAHKFLSDSALKHEKYFSGLPAEQQTNEDGKRFATKEEYSKLTPEQRKNRWVFSHSDIAYLIARDAAKSLRDELKSEEERFMKKAKMRGLISEPESQKDQSLHPLHSTVRRMRGIQEETPTDDQEAVDEKPVSPSTPIVPREAPIKAGGSPTSKSGVESFVMRSLRGK